LLQIQTGWRPFVDCIIHSNIKSIVVLKVTVVWQLSQRYQK
jgi:hypothetical protein